jgi:hypothetical protein
MTLATHIVVKDSVPAHELFRYCQSLLGDPDRQSWEHRNDTESADDWAFANRPAQGLVALLTVRHGAGRDLDFFAATSEPPHPRGSAMVTFDTGYAFSGPGGANCGDLHAWLVLQVAQWLELRGATYEWQQESTGEWFDSAEPAALAALGSAEAGALCRPTVSPPA